MITHDTPEPANALRSALPATVAPPAEADSLLLHTDLMGELQVPGGVSRELELQALSAQAAHYASRARGAGTQRVYRSAWRGYAAWCRTLGREPLAGDPGSVAKFAVDLRAVCKGLS